MLKYGTFVAKMLFTYCEPKKQKKIAWLADLAVYPALKVDAQHGTHLYLYVYVVFKF